MRVNRPLHRWTCFFSSDSSSSWRISSSAAASLLLNRPSAQPQRSHGAIRDASRWQRHHQHYWQAVYSPTLSFSIRQFASRHTKSQRRFFPASDYNSIDDLLKDSINFLNSGGSMQAAAAVWARASRLLADRQSSSD